MPLSLFVVAFSFMAVPNFNKVGSKGESNVLITFVSVQLETHTHQRLLYKQCDLKTRREEEEIILKLLFRFADDKRNRVLENLFPITSDEKFYNINSNPDVGKYICI
jgi:hypothetical protein